MTQTEAIKLFDYSDGHLYYRTTGEQVGTVVKRTPTISYRIWGTGHRSVRKVRYVHRIIYTLLRGDIPAGLVIDHIDGNGLNNNIDNLQIVTQSQNLLKAKISKTNVTGHKNIAFDKSTTKSFRPYRTVNGKKKYGTRCSTLQEAIAVRDSLA